MELIKEAWICGLLVNSQDTSGYGGGESRRTTHEAQVPPFFHIVAC
jgi:hypothetical protein